MLEARACRSHACYGNRCLISGRKKKVQATNFCFDVARGAEVKGLFPESVENIYGTYVGWRAPTHERYIPFWEFQITVAGCNRQISLWRHAYGAFGRYFFALR